MTTIIEKIIFNTEWQTTMNKIDELSTNPTEPSFECYHGYRHAFTVGKYTKDILTQLGENNHMILLGEISSLLHDIALIDGKKNHARRSASKSRKFLEHLLKEGNSLNENDIEIITHAIANHSNGEDVSSKLDLALLVADKMDVTRNRLAKTDGDLSKELNKVYDVSVKIGDRDLVLDYKTDPGFDKKAIKHWTKMLTIPRKVSDYLGLAFIFKINSETTNTEFLNE